MKCFQCENEASTKIGTAEGSMLAAFLPKFISTKMGLNTWTKKEIYLCRKCYECSDYLKRKK